MNNRIYRNVKRMVLALLIYVFFVAYAAGPIDYSDYRNSVYHMDKHYRPIDRQKTKLLSDNDYARMWNINRADWQRYRQLMRGPRGFWTPNLDPLTVLGVHANSARERKRIALIQVKLEYQRLQNELAYDRVYYQVGQQLFANQQQRSAAMPYTHSTNNKQLFKTISRTNNHLPTTTERILLFVSLVNCHACETMALESLQRINMQKNLGLDIYFVNANVADKQKISAWAKKIGVNIEAIKTNKVSLNYDQGIFSRLVLANKTLPVSLRKTAMTIIAQEN